MNNSGKIKKVFRIKKQTVMLHPSVADLEIRLTKRWSVLSIKFNETFNN